MTLGFVGTGTISAAIIRGLAAAGWAEPIIVSPRNAKIAAALAADCAMVRIAKDNQEVVDESDTVFIAVRPQIVDEVVPGLRFRADQAVVSVVATASIERIRRLIGEGPALSRAIPLPFVEQRVGATAVYPPGSASVSVFEALGKAVVAEREDQMDLLAAATSTMASFFLLQDAIAKWLVAQGFAADSARSFLGQLISGLAIGAEMRPGASFEQLIEEFSTKGGLNEQLQLHLVEKGLRTDVNEGLDALLKRVQGK